MSVVLSAGAPYPLGATLTEQGVNFAVASENANKIELVLFDQTGQRVTDTVALPERTQGIFHGFLPGSPESLTGLVYGLRAYGPYAPEQGHRFNPTNLLIDPYAIELCGDFQWHLDVFGYEPYHPTGHRSFNPRDSLPYVPKARVTRLMEPHQPSLFDPWRHRHEHTVIYELHVKGFSKLNIGIPEKLRGTYTGLAHPASIAHMKRLGITSLCLLPVTYFIDESFLADHGRTNYWGYNPLAFFALAPRYSATPEDPTATRHEFRAMVDALHAAGLEVLMDVVYNHTAEGGEQGPTLSFRGLDHATYYRLCAGDPLHCENLTGCGNTLKAAHPRVTQLILDSLRHWVTQYGIDGFRFDLAATLGRTDQGFSNQAAFFTALAQDPILSQVKMIAEPWDIGYGGYQLGHFPRQFQEWNDKYRDGMRRYWLNGGVGRSEFAQRLCASSDLFGYDHRSAFSSVNYISAHDGFTMADMTRYSFKHNEANGENNWDGRNGEPAYNFGTEGETPDEATVKLRAQVHRALMTTLVLSRGTPMIRAGDELAQTQQGNNNAYCQDSPISWIDWSSADEALIHFSAQAIALRQSTPALTARTWLDDAHVQWFTPQGTVMQVDDWHNGATRRLAVCFGENGKPQEKLLLLFNPEPTPCTFVPPAGTWHRVLDNTLQPAATDMVSGPIELPAYTLWALTPVL